MTMAQYTDLHDAIESEVMIRTSGYSEALALLESASTGTSEHSFWGVIETPAEREETLRYLRGREHAHGEGLARMLFDLLRPYPDTAHWSN